MYTHNLDPIVFEAGFVTIRWYSLAYIFGILIGWWYGKKIIFKNIHFKSEKFNLQDFDDLITYLIISIILGGRIGYIIFYNPKYYILIRDDSNSWKDMVEPKSIFYQSRLDNLEDIYKAMSSYFIENVKPNFIFKINIPLNSILEKTYLNYNITNISPNQQNKN